jgi:hypothetical protein
MRKISNQVMLITYADSMGNNLKDLYDILDEHFSGVVEGVHILPFFPSSGDRGFAPIDYFKVDPAFGSWEDTLRPSCTNNRSIFPVDLLNRATGGFLVVKTIGAEMISGDLKKAHPTVIPKNIIKIRVNPQRIILLGINPINS